MLRTLDGQQLKLKIYSELSSESIHGANIRLEGFVTMWQEIKRRKIRGGGERRRKKKHRKQKEKGKKRLNNSSVRIKFIHLMLCSMLCSHPVQTQPQENQKMKISGQNLFAPAGMAGQ